MSSITLASIDPGNGGAIALLSCNTILGQVEILELLPMPTKTITTTKVKKSRKPKPAGSKTKKEFKQEVSIDGLEVKKLLQKWIIQYQLEAVIFEEAIKNKTFDGRLLSGSASSGTTMRQYGMLTGICIGVGLPYVEIAPAVWSKIYADVEIDDDLYTWDMEDSKRKSVSKVRKLFPGVCLLKSPRSKKPNDGLSDAILIGTFYIVFDYLPSLTRQVAVA